MRANDTDDTRSYAPPMTDGTQKEHTMKRLAITLVVLTGAIGVVPAVASGADRTQVAKPALAKQQVVRQQVVRSAIAKPAVFKPAIFRTAIYRQVWLGRSIQVVRVHGL